MDDLESSAGRCASQTTHRIDRAEQIGWEASGAVSVDPPPTDGTSPEVTHPLGDGRVENPGGQELASLRGRDTDGMGSDLGGRPTPRGQGLGG